MQEPRPNQPLLLWLPPVQGEEKLWKKFRNDSKVMGAHWQEQMWWLHARPVFELSSVCQLWAMKDSPPPPQPTPPKKHGPLAKAVCGPFLLIWGWRLILSSSLSSCFGHGWFFLVLVHVFFLLDPFNWAFSKHGPCGQSTTGPFHFFKCKGKSFLATSDCPNCATSRCPNCGTSECPLWILKGQKGQLC